MPKLIIIAQGKPKEIELGQELTIGRGYSNLLRLEGEEISRVHAIIYRRDNNFILRDLDSKNGIYLNGSKVATAELGAGDKVQVGKYRMVFNPPEDFDMERFAGSSATNNSSRGKGSSNRGVQISDPDYGQSRLFSVATPERNDIVENGVARPTLREEILLLTRNEVNELVVDSRYFSSGDSRCGKLADLVIQSVVEAHTADSTFASVYLDALAKLLNADRGVIIMREGAADPLRPEAIYPADSDVAVNRVVLRSCFVENRAVFCPATHECGLFRDSVTVARENISSLISVPLGKEEPYGLIYLDRTGDKDAFEQADFAAVARVARILELHFDELKKLVGSE